MTTSCLFQLSTQCSYTATSKNGAKTHIGPFHVVWLCLFLSTTCREKYIALRERTLSQTSFKPVKLTSQTYYLKSKTVEPSMSPLMKMKKVTMTQLRYGMKIVENSSTVTQEVTKGHKQSYAQSQWLIPRSMSKLPTYRGNLREYNVQTSMELLRALAITL